MIITELKKAIHSSFGYSLLMRRGLSANSTPATLSAWRLPVIELPRSIRPKLALDGLYVIDSTKSYIGVEFADSLIYHSELGTIDEAKVKAAVNALKPLITRSKGTLPDYILESKGAFKLRIYCELARDNKTLLIKWSKAMSDNQIYSIEVSDNNERKNIALQIFKPLDERISRGS